MAQFLKLLRNKSQFVNFNTLLQLWLFASPKIKATHIVLNQSMQVNSEISYLNRPISLVDPQGPEATACVVTNGLLTCYHIMQWSFVALHFKTISAQSTLKQWKHKISLFRKKKSKYCFSVVKVKVKNNTIELSYLILLLTMFIYII